MNIHPSDKTQQASLSPLSKARPATGASSTFADVLHQATKPEVVQGSTPSTAIRPIVHPAMASPASEIYRNTERMLNALEQYQTRLGDPKTDLRAVDPALGQLKEEIAVLQPLVDQAPEQDPMKQIAQEALLIAAKEVARFEQGEYI